MSERIQLLFQGRNVTDLPIISPVLTSLIIAAAPVEDGAAVDGYTTMEQTNEVGLAFFNAYLKGEGSFTAAETN
ncbi:MAG: hypothetical protein HGA45_01390 [Chloroflexales bacterium]|nr:hypothetical protein [Chloroflexales bacterium]